MSLQAKGLALELQELHYELGYEYMPAPVEDDVQVEAAMLGMQDAVSKLQLVSNRLNVAL